MWYAVFVLEQDVRDEYIFECEVGGQPQRTKVTIFQSMGDPQVYGKIYSAKDFRSEEDVTDLHLIHPPYILLFHFTITYFTFIHIITLYSKMTVMFY